MTEQAQQDLVTVTIDGVELQAPRNSMIIEVADQAGISIPRFCYHKHLSIAANCRMCMVEVEKAPKPLPACATPINEGMQIHTRSPLAIDAQKGTMEFLLINHPLDCPICDQGGECELQDVAMGYGSDVGRFNERKRVVKDKNIGPLVSTDMTRCIHCTRCVRFGSEIAGIRELGATGRGEFMEIGTYVEKSLSSELSGNVIDLCPVGALNAKPSRMRGRAWEMVEQQNISPHDALGSNLNMHVIRNQVIRVVPQENPEINETWLSDRDRFSYEAMYSEERLKKAMRKQNGEWRSVAWSEALHSIAQTLRAYEPEDIGVLISPNQSNEEIYLMQKLARALNVNNIDHRVHQIDFSDQDNDPLIPWLGQSITQLEQQDVIVIIGSDLRNEQPLLTHRIRKAVKRGAKVIVINPQKYEFHMPVTMHEVVQIQKWMPVLISLCAAIHTDSKHKPPSELTSLLNDAEITEQAKQIAQLLHQHENTTVLVGNIMQQHFDYAGMRAIAYWLAKLSDSKFGNVALASNAVGASLLGALPHRGVMGEKVSEPGLNWLEMVKSPRKVYVLMGLEPEWDCAMPAATLNALSQAEAVISLTSFASEHAQEYCDWMLPVTCYAEAEGSKVNIEGRWQGFSKVVNADADVKDGWKILRKLANELELDGFDYFTLDEVRKELGEQVGAEVTFSNDLQSMPEIKITRFDDDDMLRIGAVPIYSIDALVRRAPSLQQAQESQEAELLVHPNDIYKWSLLEGKWVRVTQDGEKSILKCVASEDVMPGTVCIPRGLSRSEKLGAIFGRVELKNLSVT